MRPQCTPVCRNCITLYRYCGQVTIPIRESAPHHDPAALALAALGWLLSNDERGQRFLDLTGLTPEGLRGAIDEAATHRAVFAFLEAHEPDLIAAAAALDVRPEIFIRAGKELG